MKIRPEIVFAIVLACFAPVAITGTAGPFDQSLAPFTYKRNLMPDPRKVSYYQNWPRADGVYLARFASSGLVNQWFPARISSLPTWAKRRSTLNDDLAVYAETVTETGAQVLKKLDATTSASLIAFNAKHSGRIMSMVREYRNFAAQKVKADADMAKALKEVEAAMATVEADSAVSLKKGFVEEQASLAAKKQAIIDKAKKSAWVKDAFDAVTSLAKVVKDPTALAEMMAGKAAEMIDVLLVESAMQEHWRELDAIADREDALKIALTKAENDIVKNRLLAAQKRLEAARLGLIVKSMELTVVVANGWANIDELAALEKGTKKTDIFVQLQQYHYEVNKVAFLVRDHGIEYLYSLDNGPTGRVPDMLKPVDSDIADVRSRTSGDFGEWLNHADETRVYLGKHSTWYRSEQAVVGSEIAAVNAGKHLALVESSMKKLHDMLGNTRD